MVRITTEDGATVRSHTARAYDDAKYGPIRNWTRACLLARGGMGEIFVGKNTDNGQLFLIKSVARQPVWSKQLAALQNEEKILRKLSKRKCPNIFRMVGSGTSESVLEMGGKPTMDLFLEFAMPRGNLSETIRLGGPLSEPVARAYTFQLLQALSCLHRNGVVHCDIRALNIIICERGVKLVGFGLAKEVRLRASLSFGHRPVSKEDMSGPPPETHEDITALGLIVSQMVTGRLPTTDKSSPVEKVLRSLEEEFGLQKSMPECMKFIQSCLWAPSMVEHGASSHHEWTADQLLRHPWTAGFETFRPSDLTSDEEGVSLTPPVLSKLTDDNAPGSSSDSPRVRSLKKCADKLCCRKMDTDAVVLPLSSRSLNSEAPKHPRKGRKLTRLFTFPK